MLANDDLIALVNDLRSSGRLRAYEADALIEGLRRTNQLMLIGNDFLPTDYTRDGMVRWVRSMIKVYGGTAASLSKAAGLSQCALTDFIRGDKGASLRSGTIHAIIQSCRTASQRIDHVSP